MSGVSPDLREGLDLLQALKSQPDETLRQRFREAIAMYERVVVPRMDYWDREEWESAKQSAYEILSYSGTQEISAGEKEWLEEQRRQSQESMEIMEARRKSEEIVAAVQRIYPEGLMGIITLPTGVKIEIPNWWKRQIQVYQTSNDLTKILEVLNDQMMTTFSAATDRNNFVISEVRWDLPENYWSLLAKIGFYRPNISSWDYAQVPVKNADNKWELKTMYLRPEMETEWDTFKNGSVSSLDAGLAGLGTLLFNQENKTLMAAVGYFNRKLNVLKAATSFATADPDRAKKYFTALQYAMCYMPGEQYNKKIWDRCIAINLGWTYSELFNSGKSAERENERQFAVDWVNEKINYYNELLRTQMQISNGAFSYYNPLGLSGALDSLFSTNALVALGLVTAILVFRK